MIKQKISDASLLYELFLLGVDMNLALFKNKLKPTFIFVLFMMIGLMFFCSCNNTARDNYDIKDYTIDMPYKENYTVLQITDTHWPSQKDWTAGKDLVKRTVEDTIKANQKPDFIVVTGDCIDASCMDDWYKYCDFFNEFKTPWTLTFGNHDARALFSMDELTGYLNVRSASSTSYLKFKNNINDNIYGDANFAINLKENGKTKEQLIIMDSNRYRVDNYVYYDYIHEDQIEWYRRLIEQTKLENDNSVVPSVAFFHVPIPEYLNAYEEVLKGQNKYIDGECREEIYCPHKNSGLFNVMKELGSTKGIFVGDAHCNDFTIEYQGIKLTYGVKSSTNVYHDKDMLGGRIITFHKDGSFNSTMHFVSE